MRTAVPSVEFALLVACCHWPTDPRAVAAAARGQIDWSRFAALAQRHRVAGFVHRGLLAAGVQVPPSIALSSRKAAARNLNLLREAGEIAALLTEAGIAAVFLKGAALAERAYQNQGVKQTLDNDLLVSTADVPATIAVLEEAGYMLADPPVILNRQRLSVLVSLVKECTFVHPVRRVMVDLHWRASSIRGLLCESALLRDAEIIEVAGLKIPALPAETLMVYLAVHGARHGWARLKWLADFNALLATLNPEGLAAIRERARRDGAAQCMDLALFQASRLFGTAVPRDVARRNRVRWLALLSDAVMRGSNELAEQKDVPARYMAASLASTVLLSTRPRYLIDAWWSVWVAPRDAIEMPLPTLLRPIYLLISPVRRIGRLLRRGLVRG
jgi:hypothetical protein